MKINNNYFTILAFLPIFLMASLLQKFALNIAHWDDHAVRYSVKNILESNSFLEQIKLLFKQHNEHRIATTRIVALISSLFFGNVDYRFLMLIGFLFLLSTMFIIKRLSFNNFVLSIFSLLIFHPAFYENTFWGMASVQNFGVIFFSILSVSFIAKEKLALAVLAATASVFTSGNGIVVLVAIACFYVVLKDWKRTIIWFLASALILMLYYLNYTKIDSIVKTDFSNLFLLQKGFVSNAGSWIDSFVFYSSKRLIINYLIGFLNLLLATYFLIKLIFIKEKSQQESFIFIVYLFVLGSIAATTISRLGYGIETLIGSKYKIYSFLLLFLNFYSIFKFFPQSKWLILGSSLLINVGSFIFEINNVKFQKNERITESFNANPSSIHLFFDKKTNIKSYSSLIDSIEETDLDYNLHLGGFIFDGLLAFEIKNARKSQFFPIDFRPKNLRGFISNNPNIKVKIPKNEIQSGQYQVVLRIDSLIYEGENINLKGITQQKIKQNW